MIIFQEIGALQQHLAIQRQKGRRIGFVPTMGALHNGHLSLISKSRELSDITVCSIFVNPTQFNDKADFEKYPITTSTDVLALTRAATDILFLPAVDEIYPPDKATPTVYDLGFLETVLEGSHRPGHFQGVCQVVHRLLNIVAPDLMLLGQKDYQQCMVLKHLVQLLQLPTEIVVAPTIREESGLAMSSRNLRLSETERNAATAIFRALQHMQQRLPHDNYGSLQQQATQTLLESGFERVDYVAIANAATLQEMPAQNKWDGHTSVVALIAAWMGEVRLIDNMILN